MKHVRKYKLVPVNQSQEQAITTQTGGEEKTPPEKPETPPEKPAESSDLDKEVPVEDRLPPPGIPEESIPESEQKQWQAGRGEKPSSSHAEKRPRVNKPKSTKPKKKKTKTLPKWESL